MILPLERIKTTGQTAEFMWLDDDGNEVERLSGLDIYHRAGAIAKLLVSMQLKPGDRVMIAYPPGLDFLAAFVACARAGVVCCSVYPPDPSKLKKSYAHFIKFAEDAGTDVVLTTNQMKTIMIGAALASASISPFRFIVTDVIKKGEDFRDVSIDGEDIMFIQYTSGSTGNPKGVMISHRAIAKNVECICKSFEFNKSTISVCWLPQYHDYGLIGNYLTALLNGYKIVCTSPVSFIRDPLLWLRLMERYEATGTSAPNFAYALVHRKWKEAYKPFFNLSKLQNANIAAEPIHPSTIDKMLELG